LSQANGSKIFGSILPRRKRLSAACQTPVHEIERPSLLLQRGRRVAFRLKLFHQFAGYGFKRVSSGDARISVFLLAFNRRVNACCQQLLGIVALGAGAGESRHGFDSTQKSQCHHPDKLP
jgi:hypothetical protein